MQIYTISALFLWITNRGGVRFSNPRSARLARNLDDLCQLVKKLTGKGVSVEFVKKALVLTGDDSQMATLPLNMLGAVVEFEKALIKERQKEGIALAKAKGVYRGRKPT